MRHFVEHGFPGDNTIGLPEVDDGPPFDYTYFNDLGNDLSRSEFETELNKVAEYIYLSTTTRCSDFFDSCRDLEAEIDHLSLRTFGLSVSNQTAGPELTNKVGRGLAQLWVQGDPGIEFDARAKAEEIFNASGLNQDDSIAHVKTLALGVLNNAFEPIIEGARDIASKKSAKRRENLQAYLDGIFGCPRSRRTAGDIDPELCLEMEDLVGSLGLETGDKFSQEILGLIDGSELKLHNAKVTSEATLHQIKALSEQLGRAISQCEGLTEQLLSQLQDIEIGSKSDALESHLAEYCNSRLDEFVMRFVKAYYRVVTQALESVRHILGRYEAQIQIIENEFPVDSGMNLVGDEDSVECLLHNSIANELELHIAQTELQVYESIAKERGGFLKMLEVPSIWRERLAKEIRDSIQKVLSNAFKKVSLESIILQHSIGPEKLVKWLNKKILDAKPSLDSCGGSSRLLIGLPSLSSGSMLPEMLKKQFQLKGCDLKGTSGNFVLCFEAENVSFANVAFRLLEARPDAIELVKHIQTRKDIEWTTLDDLL